MHAFYLLKIIQLDTYYLSEKLPKPYENFSPTMKRFLKIDPKERFRGY